MRPARIASLVLGAALLAAAPAVAADYAFTPAGGPFDNNSDPGDVIVEDIDEDGFPDVVLGDAFGGTISIFWGMTGATFNPMPTELAGPGAELVVIDLDGDGDLDIAGAGSNFQPFLKNNGVGVRTFVPGTSQSVDTGDQFDQAAGMVAADFDQDGDNDIAISVDLQTSGGPSGGAVRLVRNNTELGGPSVGTFTFEADIVEEEDAVGQIVVGFFDAGADPDLAYLYFVPGVGEDFGDTLIGVQLGAAGRTFGTRTNIEDASFDDLLVADLDDDGEDDLVTEGSTDVRWGNGDGTFDAPTQAHADDAFGFFVGDFNDDGLLDLGLGGDPLILLTNQGSRTFAVGATYGDGASFGFKGTAADLDADPRDDLVLGTFFSFCPFLTVDAIPAPAPSRCGPPPDDDDDDDGGGSTNPPPSDTTPGPGPAPPAPGPGPGPSTPPLTQPVIPVRANQIATLPSNRKCASRRNFKIRLRRPPAGVTVTSATVLINAKRVKVVRGARLTAPVDLRGLPKGKVTVTIRIVLSDGRTLRGSRKYRTCATKKRKGKFGRKKRG